MKNIFPNVSSLKTLEGKFDFTLPFKIHYSLKNIEIKSCFEMILKKYYGDCRASFEDNTNANVIFTFDDKIPSQGYELLLENNKAVITYSDKPGAYYGIQTFFQLLNNKRNLFIHDEPKILTRGLMLDISRDRVLKCETIERLIDYMAYLKMNHLELYVEGFSFEYKSFPDYLEKDGYLTIAEYIRLEEYANMNCIDLVPNQNGFGHMTKWLEKKELSDLAVCPLGIDMWGRHRSPSTLNPLNPKSLELISKMYDDMLPCFKSSYFNMNFDEPFELGHGLTEGMDKGKLYLDYVQKAYKLVKEYNKIPLIWGDVLLNHQDLWDKLPKDMIFLDWGYDANYPFMSNAKKLKEKDIPFICAPGTTSWCSFLGRYYDMHDSIKNAIDACYLNNGKGVILTDWGDFGHLQSLGISYAPIAFMGLYSWSMKEGIILKVRDVINNYFQDQNDFFGDILLDLSNYYRYENEYCGNGSRSFYIFMWGSVSIFEGKRNNMDPITYFINKTKNTYLSKERYIVLNNYVDRIIDNLSFVKSENYDTNLVCEDLKQTVKLLKMIWSISLAYNENVNLDYRLKEINSTFSCTAKFLTRQRELWLTRSKSGGLESSIKYIENFIEFARLTLTYLSKRGEQ